MPAGTSPAWLAQGRDQYLLNVAWLRPGKGAGTAGRIPATRFAAKNGTQNAPCSEGGECIGFIEHGHWVRYEQVDFGSGTEQMEIRAASASGGGIIEIRLDQPDGELLGTCPVPNTGDWQDWASFQPRIKPVSGIKTLCLVFKGRPSAPLNAPLWFAQVDAANTTIWAQFPGRQPERATGRDQRPPDGVLPGPAGPQLHHRARLHPAPRRHPLGAADGRADRPDRHPLEQGLDHREQRDQPLGLLRHRARQTRRPVRQHLGRHRRGLREDHRARPRASDRLDPGEHRPPCRPQQHDLALRADGHRRQPRRRVQHRHRQHHPRHPRPPPVHRRRDGRHQVPRRH